MSRKHRRKKIRAAGFARRSLPGAAPGTLVADPKAPHPVIQVMAYGPDKLIEQPIADVQALRPLLQQWPVMWVNVTGLGDAAVISGIGEIFDLHRLALEDVIHVHQRPKVEQYKDHCFIVVREIIAEERLASEQVSMFLGKDFVITFQEYPGDPFDPVRERIRKSLGRIRNSGADHLAYALIDATIDNYFPVLESVGEKLEALEDAVIASPDRKFVSQIHDMRQGLLLLRRTAWPLRDAINALHREPLPLITDDTRLHLRDCYDHTIQIIDLLENYRDVASSLMEVYLSSLSNRTNEIVKVLTILTAVFIPLTLIAGIYGMNFDAIPELHWPWGYPFALGLMFLVALAMLFFFRRRGWLGADKSDSGTDNGNAKP